MTRSLLAALILPASLAPAASPSAPDEDPAATLVPLLQTLCADCHGEKKQKARFALHDIHPDIAGGADLERWEKILEMVSIGDMPPEDEPQPSEDHRKAIVEWITKNLKAAGRGPVEGQLDLPKYGNRVDHGELFSGRHRGPAYTESRLWRISPEIYQRFSNKIQMARKFNAPLQTAGTEGFGDYSHLYADEATILTMLQNCKRAATTMLLGTIKRSRNRSSTVNSEQGGRTGSRHRIYTEFITAEGTPDRAEMEEVLDYSMRFLLDRGARPGDRERYLDGFLGPVVKESGRYEGLRGLLTTLMMSAEFLFRMELGLGEELPDGRRMLAPREIAYALSYALFDYVDPKALKAAEDGRLETREEVVREFRRMLSERDRQVRGPTGRHLWTVGKGAGVVFAKHMDVSHPRLLRFWREFFGYTKAADVFKDDARHGGKHVPFSRIRDADWFVLRILREDKDVFARLLTDDHYHVGNSRKPHFNEPAYNFDEDTPWPEDRGEFAQVFVPMPDGQRAGMLTHPAWLAAHSGNFENDPVRRGKWVREHLLAGVVPDLPIGVDAQLPEEPHRTLRQRFDVVKAEECWRCHKKMNPLGYPFEAYDDFGRHRTHHLVDADANVIASELETFSRSRRNSRPKGAPPREFSRIPVDSRGVLDGTGDPELDGEVTDAVDLAHRLARSELTRQSIIRHVFRFWMGRNETLNDSPTLMAMDRAYLDSGGSFRELLVSLVTSDSFLYRKTP